MRILPDIDVPHPSLTFISSISPHISSKEPDTLSTSSAMPEPSVFLSYVHDDDKHLDGMLVKFAGGKERLRL